VIGAREEELKGTTEVRVISDKKRELEPPEVVVI
jgi:hypothetical protein